MYVVYIAEAHTTDGWQMPANLQDGTFCLRQPATFEERLAAARLVGSHLAAHAGRRNGQRRHGGLLGLAGAHLRRG